MTAEQASEQASQDGDVPTSQEGQPLESVASIAPPVAQPKEPEAKDQKDSADPKVSNEDAQKWRKSDKEWQDAQEKAKKADTLEVTVKEKEVEEKSLREEVESLKEYNKRLEWEKKHPIVDDERYQDTWKETLDQKGHLVRKGDLTYDDLWKLVTKEDPSSVRRDEAAQQIRDQGSVPVSSRSAPSKPGLDPATLEMGRGWGNTPADFEKYGIR